MLRLTGRQNRDAGRVPVLPVASGQLLSWGTLYYGITLLAQPISGDTGWSLTDIFGAFSASLLVTALMAVPVGRWLARFGGRLVMSTGSLLAAAAFAVLALSQDLLVFYIGWLLAGLAMSMTLYEAVFSTLRESAGHDFRKAIALVTLVGGLASTLFWPLTHWLVLEFGWRMTTVVFAAAHLFIGVPLHRTLPRRNIQSVSPAPLRTSSPQQLRASGVIPLLALAFAFATLVTAAISSHVVILLAELHIEEGLAVMLLSLIGPMQVAGRLLELRLSHRISVLALGRIAFLGLALSLLVLYGSVASPWPAFAFVLLYGAANGVLTVVRGGAPVELLAGSDYASALGAISAPALAARAIGPMLAALVMGAWSAPMTIGLFLLVALCGFAVFWSVTTPVRARSLQTKNSEVNG